MRCYCQRKLIFSNRKMAQFILILKNEPGTAITHNEITESIAISARKTITIIFVTMSLNRFSAV